MKFVYPLKSGVESKTLKASIRSVAKQYPNAEIVIIGDKPKWLRRCEHIPFKEKAFSKNYVNVWNKLMVVANKYSEPFIWMNDDFILNDKFDWENNQLSYKDLEYRKSGVSETSFYRTRINRTYSLLEGLALSNTCYDNHQPMVMNPEILKWMEFHFKMRENGYLFKTIYGNLTEKSYKQYDYAHCKINSFNDYSKDMVYFSSSVLWKKEDYEKLNLLFNEKCIFEIAR